jgi:hypothetical protein
VSGSDPVRPPASDVRFTYDNFLQFPDDGKRHELIGSYVRGHRVDRDDALESPLFPGLTLRLSDIFEE